MRCIFVRYSQPLLEGQNLSMKVKELLLTKVLFMVRLCDIPYQLKLMAYWVWWKKEGSFTNFHKRFVHRLC